MRGPFWQSLLLLLAATLISVADAICEEATPRVPRGDYLSHLFIAPTGRMLPSGMVSVALGGAFASQGGKEYLGLISVGLGGVAEFEFSTAHVVTNVFNSSAPIGTTSLKFLIYDSKAAGWFPDLVLALRSNRWSNVNGGADDLTGPASPGGGSGVSQIDFETHLTSLFLAATSNPSPEIALHYGIGLEEVRIRSLNYSGTNALSAPGNARDNTISFFAGVERTLNENTQSIIEVGGKPQIKFDKSLRSVKVEELWHIMGGVRFFVTRMIALDAGLKYRSDYDGLSEIEIRSGLTVGIDLQKSIVDNLKPRSTKTK